jgi:hypothetical protein
MSSLSTDVRPHVVVTQSGAISHGAAPPREASRHEVSGVIRAPPETAPPLPTELRIPEKAGLMRTTPTTGGARGCGYGTFLQSYPPLCRVLFVACLVAILCAVALLATSYFLQALPEEDASTGLSELDRLGILDSITAAPSSINLLSQEAVVPTTVPTRQPTGRPTTSAAPTFTYHPTSPPTVSTQPSRTVLPTVLPSASPVAAKEKTTKSPVASSTPKQKRRMMRNDIFTAGEPVRGRQRRRQ